MKCHSCNQLCPLVHQSHRFSLCCIVKGSWSNGHQVDRPLCYKCRPTVWMETGRAANIPISWLLVHDVVIQFCRADLTICLSSRALVMGEHWHPACHSVWPSATHWLHICTTVGGLQLVRYHRTIIHSHNRPLLNYDTCWYAFLLITRGTTWYSEQTLTLQSAFRKEINYTTFLLFRASDVISPSKCTEILIICMSQPLFVFRWVWRSSDHFFLVLQF